MLVTRPKLAHELTEREKDELILEIARKILRVARLYASPDAPDMAFTLAQIEIRGGDVRADLVDWVERHKREWLVNSHHRGDWVGVFGRSL